MNYIGYNFVNIKYTIHFNNIHFQDLAINNPFLSITYSTTISIYNTIFKQLNYSHEIWEDKDI